MIFEMIAVWSDDPVMYSFRKIRFSQCESDIKIKKRREEGGEGEGEGEGEREREREGYQLYPIRRRLRGGRRR